MMEPVPARFRIFRNTSGWIGIGDYRGDSAEVADPSTPVPIPPSQAVCQRSQDASQQSHTPSELPEIFVHDLFISIILTQTNTPYLHQLCILDATDR